MLTNKIRFLEDLFREGAFLKREKAMAGFTMKKVTMMVS
ncbi:hypothetical protein BREVNS_0458 [Brevinematales bacterium NS]|nr:hypothetical protein BREVNS_0458 [Brevinematales bacterium NS]